MILFNDKDKGLHLALITYFKLVLFFLSSFKSRNVIFNYRIIENFLFVIVKILTNNIE